MVATYTTYLGILISQKYVGGALFLQYWFDQERYTDLDPWSRSMWAFNVILIKRPEILSQIIKSELLPKTFDEVCGEDAFTEKLPVLALEDEFHSKLIRLGADAGLPVLNTQGLVGAF